MVNIKFYSFTGVTISVTNNVFRDFNVGCRISCNRVPANIVKVTLGLLSATIVPPLIRRFTYHNVILKFLQHCNSNFTIFISSLLFNVVRKGFRRTPFTFVVKLVLNFMAMGYGSV